jgi:pimeloyl-ACP methyl ester carboxylesterase
MMRSTIAVAALALTAQIVLAQPPPSTSRDGLRLRSEGAGPQVVLIHAFHMDMREWDDVVARIASGRSVLRYDVRGHGGSPAIDPPPSWVADLTSLLDERAIERATIAGSSMGATIAMDFALTHPGRVERLVLVSPGIPGAGVPADLQWMAPIGAAIKAGDVQQAAALWWESPLLAGVLRLPDANRHRAVVIDNAGVWALKRRPPPLDPPAGARLDQVAAPVLAIAGALDRSGSIENARAVAAGVRQGRFRIVEGAGHMLTIEAPAEVAAAILEVGR